VVQIRTTDRAGLLAILTAVFERACVDIAWAKVTTLGSSVVDVFCINVPALASGDVGGGGADYEVVRAALEHDLYDVLPKPAQAKPAEEAS
jgi:[protein-PII] uridylyltransferase